MDLIAPYPSETTNYEGLSTAGPAHGWQAAGQLRGAVVSVLPPLPSRPNSSHEEFYQSTDLLRAATMPGYQTPPH